MMYTYEYDRKCGWQSANIFVASIYLALRSLEYITHIRADAIQKTRCKTTFTFDYFPKNESI